MGALGAELLREGLPSRDWIFGIHQAGIRGSESSSEDLSPTAESGGQGSPIPGSPDSGGRTRQSKDEETAAPPIGALSLGALSFWATESKTAPADRGLAPLFQNLLSELVSNPESSFVFKPIQSFGK